MSTIASEYISAPTLTSPNAPTNTTTSSSSTAATAVNGNGFHTFVARTSDCWIVFGPSTMAAATVANAFAMPVGVPFTWKLEVAQTHFRVIATGAGTLSWYKSGP